jgi:hypothetical protein
MKQRRVGPLEVSAIGLGCMNLSHAYGVPPSPEVAEKLLLKALDLGVTLFDTAALYGFGANESLLGRVLAPHRAKIVLASKCGMTGVNGARVIDNRPETLRRTCEESLRRLRTDVIDLYYLHRFDRRVPIEESVGALADLVRAGKVRTLGLSEVSAETLRRAHAVHPISALQSEYSLWSRNPEIAGLAACRELGTSLVAFSPIARGFLSGRLREVATLDAKDIRRNMPRFQPAAFDANLSLLPAFAALADEAHCTPAQLALAWLLAQDDRLVPIPGTTRTEHLAENVGAASVQLDAALLARVDAAIDRHAVTGPRYNATTQAEIDSEEFPV